MALGEPVRNLQQASVSVSVNTTQYLCAQVVMLGGVELFCEALFDIVNPHRNTFTGTTTVVRRRAQPRLQTSIATTTQTPCGTRASMLFWTPRHLILDSSLCCGACHDHTGPCLRTLSIYVSRHPLRSRKTVSSTVDPVLSTEWLRSTYATCRLAQALLEMNRVIRDSYHFVTEKEVCVQNPRIGPLVPPGARHWQHLSYIAMPREAAEHDTPQHCDVTTVTGMLHPVCTAV